MDDGLNRSSLSRSNFVFIIFIYLSVFINSYTFFTQPFEFYFGYLIYIVLLPVFIRRHTINLPLLGIFSVLLISGLVNIYSGNNTLPLFFKVYTGLLLSYFFYYYVIIEFDFNIEFLFKIYLSGCYIVCLIGLFQFFSFLIGFKNGYSYYWIFNKWGLAPGGLFGIRINSIFAEPTHFAGVVSGAFFVSLIDLTKRQGVYFSKFKCLVIVTSYILSFSGIGQTGIFVAVVLLAINYGIFRYIFIIVPASIFLFNVLYKNVDEFKDRYDGIVGLYSGEQFKIGKTHGSSFILYNNYVVTRENFKSNYLFGGGIGSHPIAFAKYSLARNIRIAGFNNNSADANSMLLRLISETGLFGTCLFLFFVFRCYVRRNEEHNTYHWIVSNSILVMIILNLFRQGHYFLNGFPFFVLLYCYNYFSYQKYIETGKDIFQLNSEESIN